ncbi:putative esterase [Paenibacillus curdlanolyticus YK9]|uniref:Putative esterase n=1 Tax=Paenibacillus curdlanolyticus YK9 TaxID=717606 RepID=E0I5D9_9BACL|nr:alpha/beta hydrolase-fold protein [Paenibacillus curdlanolyticus]EFM12181.1 putative esterase [Paenibacillus curdlanolyticus YK9]
MPDQSVIVTIDNFHARKLNNERRIFVYLPPSYGRDLSKRYPVLYMHAGQRAFAPAAPGTESWNIHLAADRLISEGAMEEIIIVAIAHVRPVESNEYYHFSAPMEEMKAGIRCSGLDYEDFLVHDLKPHIDEHFRTLSDPANTGLIGSSAGALSTYHTGFRRPDVFGKLIMLSPYFVKAQLDETSETKLREEELYRSFDGLPKPPLKLWLDIGDAEGLFLPRHIRDFASGLMAQGFKYGEELAYLEQPDAAHQEADWGERVHIPLLYMFGRPGNAISLELRGRDVIGLTGMQSHLNALLQYDSGLAMTILDGAYRVEDPDVLTVLPDGMIVPKRTGSTVITLYAGGLETSKTITVVEEMSHFVTVRMDAEVPVEPEMADYIFGGMGMKLALTGENRYTGTFIVPRDSGYRFRFTRGFRKFELDAVGNTLPNRSFRACEDMTLYYQIERWDGASAQAQVRRSYADPTF